VPKDKVDGVREIANEFLKVFLQSYCVKQFDGSNWGIKILRGISVKDGRLFVFLL
jgi:hypothetical protein